MPLQSKTGVSSRSSTDDVALARKLLNLAGRGVDAAFRTLTVDNFLSRGNITAQLANLVSTRYITRPTEVVITTTSLGTGVFTKLKFGGRFYDPSNKWDLTNDQYTVTTPGAYSISCAFTITAGAAASPLTAISLFINGVETRRSTSVNTPAVSTATVQGAFSIVLLTGSVVDVRGFQNSGGALSALTGNALGYCDIQFIGNL